MTDLYYKAVRLDRTSHYDKATRWPKRKGSIVSAGPGNYSVTDDGCGHGIHSSPTLLEAMSYQSGPSLYLAVEPRKVIQTSVAGNRKARSRAVKIDHWLTPQETDELAGFRLWEANHPVNPLTLSNPDGYNPMADLRRWDSVWASVWDSVWDSGWNSSWNSVWNSVRDSVWGYIGGLFPNITYWSYVDGPDPWRSLLNLWYAGFIPSFDGTTWRLHSGPSATVALEWTP